MANPSGTTRKKIYDAAYWKKTREERRAAAPGLVHPWDHSDYVRRIARGGTQDT